MSEGKISIVALRNNLITTRNLFRSVSKAVGPICSALETRKSTLYAPSARLDDVCGNRFCQFERQSATGLVTNCRESRVPLHEAAVCNAGGIRLADVRTQDNSTASPALLYPLVSPQDATFITARLLGAEALNAQSVEVLIEVTPPKGRLAWSLAILPGGWTRASFQPYVNGLFGALAVDFANSAGRVTADETPPTATGIVRVQRQAVFQGGWLTRRCFRDLYSVTISKTLLVSGSLSYAWVTADGKHSLRMIDVPTLLTANRSFGVDPKLELHSLSGDSPELINDVSLLLAVFSDDVEPVQVVGLTASVSTSKLSLAIPISSGVNNEEVKKNVLKQRRSEAL